MRCYVEDCEGRAEHTGILQVMVPGSKVIRTVRVALCSWHETFARVPGAPLRLAKHPDDTAPDMTLPE